MNKQQHQDIDIRPFAYAISLIDGKWKMPILFWLWKKEIMRYSELKRALGSVSYKMLSNQLKELERNLSETGKTIMPILSSLCKWGNAHIPNDWIIE